MKDKQGDGHLNFFLRPDLPFGFWFVQRVPEQSDIDRIQLDNKINDKDQEQTCQEQVI
jgi:hypothetical protein